LEFTGERFNPQHADPYEEIAVEHQQRYHAAAGLVRGKIVLDAGSGEGYGACFLAATAARVFGIDVSAETVRHAAARYRRHNLEFGVGSAEALPFPDGMFDVVISFEVIEHLEETQQIAFLREARRVLKESGVLVISTPNKAVYSDPSAQHNRFHKHEFHVSEFERFLLQVFPRISLFGQSWSLSSALERPDSRHLLNIGFSAPGFSPKYLVAVCGATDLVNTVDLSSVVLDRQKRLEGTWGRIHELQSEIAARNQWAATLERDLENLRIRVVELQQEVVQRNDWATALTADLEQARTRIVDLQDEVSSRSAWIAALQGDLALAGDRIHALQSEIEEKNAWIAGQEKQLETWSRRILALQQEVEEKNQWAISLDRKIGDLDQKIQQLLIMNQSKEAELAMVRGELELIKQSDFYKIASRYWRLRDQCLPHGSRRRRLLKRAVRFLMRGNSSPSMTMPRAGAAAAEPAPATLRKADESAAEPAGGPAAALQYARLGFAAAGRPKVSIIIPVWNQWAYTYRCLQSVHRTMAGLACEVLLADDGSTDLTSRAEEWLDGVRILRAGNNRGFLRNCNWAAGQAHGEYLFFLNNDTELQPEAIQSLVALLDRDPGFGMAGSKLLFPDGIIQEAGGIIWADGSGWNFGRGQEASLPAFNYVKEVDYVSGASFMIRRSLWEKIGGFDERYAPAYCEDSDLAFAVRQQGYKVGYQPRSAVVHFEGASHGTDTASGMKACQVRNTEHLRSKWASVLVNHFPNGTHVFQARDRSAHRNTILIVDHYVPHFDRDAGSRTMWSFIQAFLAMGMNVKFLGDNFFPHQPYTEILQQAGVEVLVGPWCADNWPEWLEENGRYVDFVLLSRPHIAPKYLRALRSKTEARILYYVHDLHYLREEHHARVLADPSLLKQAQESKADEQHLMNQMDVICSCSDSETEILRNLCPGVKVFYTPAYSVDADPAWDFDAGKRSGILFVGGFIHPPNADGVQWFVREVWPAVRARLPEVVCSIAGADPPPEIRALASDHIKVLGFVSEEQLAELYRTSRLVVVPLRYGAGVKGKTVEAMAHGVPVVCTSWGIEGMPGIREILDPAQCCDSLADGIVALYQDESRLKEISKRERAYVAGHFTIENIRAAFGRVIEDRSLSEN